MLFTDIIGNEYIKRYLQRALDKNTLGNTLLFSGVEGIGKFLFAKAIAPKLMSIDEQDIHAVNRINQEKHPDFHVLRPEGKTALHNIASVRSLIDSMSLSPFEASSQVFVIEEAHRMLPSSFNALLKTLEEPDLETYIILITDRETELLPTIVSRCTKLKFSPLSDTDIISILERWGKTKAESKRIASLAQGSVSRASEISSFVEDDDKTKILIDILSKNNIKNYLDLSLQLDSLQAIFDKIDKDNDSNNDSYRYKYLNILFSHIFMWYRDLHLFKNKLPLETLFYSDKIELIKKQSISALPSLDRVNTLISDAISSIERNIKIKTCLENLFFKLNII